MDHRPDQGSTSAERNDSGFTDVAGKASWRITGIQCRPLTCVLAKLAQVAKPEKGSHRDKEAGSA
jgi:hypothetical protein